jgi:hypothetical protein
MIVSFYRGVVVHEDATGARGGGSEPATRTGGAQK